MREVCMAAWLRQVREDVAVHGPGADRAAVAAAMQRMLLTPTDGPCRRPLSWASGLAADRGPLGPPRGGF